MIFYYCNVGHSDIYTTKIDEITWTDIGKPFTIATIQSHDPVNTLYPYYEGAYAAYSTILGEDINALYSPPYPGGGNISEVLPAYESLIGYIPSIPLAYPNAYSYSTGYFYLIIPKLNNLMFISTNRGTSPPECGYVLARAVNGVIVNSGITGYNLLNSQYQKSGVGVNGMAVMNYSGPSDLKDASKMYWHGTYFPYPVSLKSQVYLSRMQQAAIDYIFGSSPPEPDKPGEPYDPINPSGPTDEDTPPGTFDDTSDPIPDSSLPTLSSANTGFTRIYNPTLTQVQALANYLWTDESVITTIWNHIKQYFEDPMQAIIGFNLVPVPVPDGGVEEFKLMYIGTGVNMTVAASQFVDVDCGTLSVERYYGSYLDYAPYTKISCFLPYIGNVELNPDEIMGTTLQVKYRVDICAGSCVAKILVDNNCLYQYSGHCAINIPLSSADFSSYVSAAISVAKLGVGVATAGAFGAAGLEAGEVVQTTSSVTTTKTKRNPDTGRQITASTSSTTREKTEQTSPSSASYAGLTPKNVSNTIGEIMGSKPGFQHSGSFSGNTGYLGVRRPFLIITRPNLCLPESYKTMNGYPSMITMPLSDCTGFTQVQQIQFSGSSATNPEQDEILQFLKMGVVF